MGKSGKINIILYFCLHVYLPPICCSGINYVFKYKFIEPHENYILKFLQGLPKSGGRGISTSLEAVFVLEKQYPLCSELITFKVILLGLIQM